MNATILILILAGIFVPTAIFSSARSRARTRRWMMNHTAQDGAAFLEGCRIAHNEDEQRLALAVRQALGDVAGVPPDSIAANVLLIELSEGLDVRWDDWQDVRFRVKRLTGFKIGSKTWFNNPLLLEVEREKLEFQHVVRAGIAACAETMGKK